ncbi:MAG TPA: hypothetical protein VF507_08885 [Pyrinomonadaceae bacterium]|jgi:hypothetical protein
MKALIFVALLLALASAGSCSLDRNTRIFKSYDLPSHAGLTYLCQKSSSNRRYDFTWDVFVSSAAPSELLADYRAKLGEAGFTKWKEVEGGGWVFYGEPTRELYVMPVAASTLKDFDVTCGQTPSPDSRSRIVLMKTLLARLD